MKIRAKMYIKLIAFSFFLSHCHKRSQVVFLGHVGSSRGRYKW